MDDIVFTKGKYAGKTYKDVRINHTSYFFYLVGLPPTKVPYYQDFIQYCMSYLTADKLPVYG